MNSTKVFSASLTVCAALFLLLSLTSTTSADLIGHWALDETTGSTAVDSVAGNNGALQGGMTFDADPNGFGTVPGVFGGALRGFSAAEYVDVGNVLNPGTSDYSVTGWFKAASQRNGFVFAKGNGVTSYPAWSAIYSSSKWDARASANDTPAGTAERKRFRTDVKNNVDTWYHVALVFDKDPATPDPDCCDGNDATSEWNFTAYLDGNPFPVKNINEEMSGAITTNESIYFGRRVGTGWVGGAHNSDGAIDDVGIFDVALTPSQIQDIMSNGVASFAPACDFDGGGCGLSDINLMMTQGDLVAGVSVSSGNKFDLDNDNDIDGDDITEWLSLTGTKNSYGSPMLRGDTDNVGASSPTSRTVDITDFQNFLAGFTGAGSTWDVGNFNGDDVVDITDFSNHFLPNFSATGGGTYGAGQSVPEPSTVLLLGLGGLLLAYLCGCGTRRT